MKIELKQKLIYKKAIKSASKRENREKTDEISQSLADRDTTGFWRSWKAFNNKPTVQTERIEDAVTTENIANKFAKHFESVFQPNHASTKQKADDEFVKALPQYIASNPCDCASHKITREMVALSISRLKPNKAAAGSIVAEHLLHGSLHLIDHFYHLYSSAIHHGFVPYSFRHGIVVPLIKDSNGDPTALNNYRGLTLSDICSKPFEYLLKDLFADYLETQNQHFGYKNRHSTNHAVFLLKETVNCFTKNGGAVYAGFLDATKAFDRVVHSKLFHVLLNRKAPICFLRILIFWYGSLTAQVKWDGFYSHIFLVIVSVCQGGILSPYLWCVYTDELVIRIENSKVGCHFKGLCLAIICYADDVVLLAPSLRALQILLNISYEFGVEFDIQYRPESDKMRILAFGKLVPPVEQRATLLFGDKVLQWENRYKYLGLVIVAGPKLQFCIKDRLSKFYASLNGIVRAESKPSDVSLIYLLVHQAVPALTFGFEVTGSVLTQVDLKKLQKAYNTCFRISFGIRQSVREVQEQTGYQTWEALSEVTQSRFTTQAYLVRNSLVDLFLY